MTHAAIAATPGSTLVVWAVDSEVLPSASVATVLRWGSTCPLATSLRATCAGAPEIALRIEGTRWQQVSTEGLEHRLSQHCIPSDIE